MTDLRILVDADACPVKDEILRVAGRYDLGVDLVSNQWLRLEVGPKVNKVVVSDGFDAADDWIAERASGDTIVITADIQLAERALKAGAPVLGPNGHGFTPDNIGMALAMRALNQDLRDMGSISGSGKGFEKADRSRFLSALDKAIQTWRKGSPQV